MGQNPLGGLSPNFWGEEDIRDVITCVRFGDDRFTDLASAEGQILPFPIDFDGRPYNTVTPPCERVMCSITATPDDIVRHRTTSSNVVRCRTMSCAM